MAKAVAESNTEEKKTTAVAVASKSQLPADMQDEFAEYAGAGTSQDAADNLIPFLAILQDMSPQTKKRDAAYVEGAEPGMIFQTASGAVYSGEQGILFQPVFFQKLWVEWVPRAKGGGFVKAHLDLPSNAVLTEYKGDDGQDREGYRTPEGNDVIETRYFYGHVLDEEGEIVEPAVIGMSSTGHTAGRQWMVLQNNHKVRGREGQMLIAPSWSCAYRLRTMTKSNAQGEWFVWKITDHAFGDSPWIPEKAVRDAGRKMHESIKSGAKQAAVPEAEGGSGGDSDGPF